MIRVRVSKGRGAGMEFRGTESEILDGEIARVPHEKLRDCVRLALMGVEVPRDEAELVADCLVDADLRGVYSHGVMRLPVYIHHLKKAGPGRIAPRAEIRALREGDAFALIDGGNGLGPVVSAKAMDMAIEKARASGIASVGVRNSNHNGAEAYFSMMALEHDMVGFCATVGGKNILAPWGGLTPLLGNNPFSFAIPSGEELPVVLDMACSVVARGWILLAMKNNWEIPEGFAVNKDGVPTRDAKEAYEGLVLPVGGYKGYGLALIGCILAGVLTGAAIGSEVTDLYQDFDRDQNVGHFMGALSIEKFMPVLEFKGRMDMLIRELKSSKLMKGQEKIYLPGEKEFEAKARNLREGIPLSKGVLDELNKIGEASLDI
jgi:LDH2 family malate/lactate/ureidoglycolate dehydrogenase